MTNYQPSLRGFSVETLSCKDITSLEEMARQARINVLTMVALAGSGHPAGSLSSMDMYLMTYGVANLTPENCNNVDRDYVVVSHGHTSPGAYSALAAWGFFDPLDAAANFRLCASPFQGHVEREVPGIDWGSGNLGQGLAAGVGFALAQKARQHNGRVFVLLGDGEQTKGQVAEARRVAVKEGLSNITALIDYNHIQISGRTENVMPADVRALWEADGWGVLECDGHSFTELYAALRDGASDGVPTAIICHTLMGKGVSFMEGIPDYHGKAPNMEQYRQAVVELGGDPHFIEEVRPRRGNPLPLGREVPPAQSTLCVGEPRTYSPTEKTDNRSAFGHALADIGARNYEKKGGTPLLVFDCDLAGSVKTDGFAKACPHWFIQAGIQEHGTATMAGAASVAGVSSLWADFGVFGLSEVYNQQRLNDINKTGLKLALTHVGLDVGEDGMTHQAIDYIGLLRNMFGWKLVVPADPNQTDRATRWAFIEPGNVCLAMGRSKLPTLVDEEGLPIFAGNYSFEYGKAVKIRDGKDGAIFALGAMTWRALEAWNILREKGITVKIFSVSCPLHIDTEALKEACSTGAVITAEDHHYQSGLGAATAFAMAQEHLFASFLPLGVWRYGDSGKSDDVFNHMGLNSTSIASRVEEVLSKK